MGKWRYRTGVEIPEILGSGSTVYNTFESYDFQEVYKESTVGSRNFLHRIKYEGDKRIMQYYDYNKGEFINE